MAQVGIDQRVFLELSNQFPEIPEEKVKTVIRQNSNNVERCVNVLSHESNRILYNGPPVEQFHGLTIEQPNRPRSQSGCSSGSEGAEFRGRSDSTGSRSSLPGALSGASGMGQQQPHYGSNPGMHHSSTTPAFTSTHRAYVTPGPPTAPPSSNNLEHYMSPPQGGGFALPTIPCSVSGDSRIPSQYQGASAAGAYGQQPNSYAPSGNSGQQGYNNPSSTQGNEQPVPFHSASGATGGFGAQWINSNMNTRLYPQAQNVIYPNNRSAVYPYQKNANWSYPNQGNMPNSSAPDAHGPNRPETFNQGFPQTGRTVSDTSPHYVPGNASLPYMSPDRLAHSSHSPTTPTRPAVTPPDGAYGMHQMTPNNNYPGGSPGYPYASSTPPGANPPPATHVSSVYIPVNATTTPPVTNNPTSIYVTGQTPTYPQHLQGGGAGGMSLPVDANQIHPAGGGGGRFDQRPPVYQQPMQPKRLMWKEGPVKSDWTDKDPIQERFMQPPMQPTVTPSPTSSGGTSLPNFDALTGQMPVNRRHSAGSEDSAYAQALCLHQQARMQKLCVDLEDSQYHRDSLRMEVGLMEKQMLQKRKARNNIISAEDLHKVREENRRIKIDIQILAREIDMFNNGQTPLGWTDPHQSGNTNQNFHCNIPTGQLAPVSSAATRPTDVNIRQVPPARPPPPRHPPAYTRSPSEPNPPLSMMSLPPSHPPPPPSIIPPRHEPEEEENWNCSACTFANHPLLDKCECCEMPRVQMGQKCMSKMMRRSVSKKKLKV